MTFYRQASCDKCVHLQKIMLRKDFSCLLLIISHFQAVFFRSLVFGNVLCGPLWNIHLICIFRIFVFSISFLSIFVGCFFLHFIIGKILSVCVCVCFFGIATYKFLCQAYISGFSVWNRYIVVFHHIRFSGFKQ